MRGPRRLPAAQDPVRPKDSGPVSITLDGEPVSGLQGQSIAGVLMGAGRLSWRQSPRTGRPRGVFCGIGVCFDCLVTVNEVPDVRACQRRAGEGDVVTTQTTQTTQTAQEPSDG